MDKLGERFALFERQLKPLESFLPKDRKFFYIVQQVEKEGHFCCRGL